MCNKSIICGVSFASVAIAFYEGSSCGFYGLYTMERNNYRDPPNASTSCKNFISPLIKISKSKCFPSTSILAFSYNVLFSEKWVCKQVLNDHNLLCSLQCKKHFDLLMIMSNHR